MDFHKSIKLVLPFLLFSIVAYFIIVPPIYAEKAHDNPVNKTDSNEKTFHLSINNGLLTLEAHEADINKVLEEISARTGVEIGIYGSLVGTISTFFHDVPLEEALKKIAVNRGIVFSKEIGQNDYQISKVIVLPSSRNQHITRANSNTDNRKLSKHSSQEPSKLISTTIKTGRPTSLTLIDEKSCIKSKIVSNELVLRFKKGLSKDAIQSLIAVTGATIKTNIKALNYYVLSLPPNLSVNDAMLFYRKKEVVDQVEPNYLIPVKTGPNDPNFSSQWALNNTGQTGGTDDSDIDAIEGWDIELGKAEVVIAIVDTGVDYTHQDLAANIWHNPGEIPDNGVDDDGNGYIDDTIGWDFVDSFGGASGEDFVTPDNDPMDRHGHGTHVAGIAGAVTNNGVGIAGVAWNCKIMPVRAGYKTSSGDGVLESDDSAQAIVYAAENGAKVINLSWGDYQKSNLIEDAVKFAAEQGALICAAAGNENSSNLLYPAALENSSVIAIGATDSLDKGAYFSNFGDWVDVSAPGVSIHSTHLTNSYTSMSGTSMATPHVAGLAGLLFSQFPGLSPPGIKARIMRAIDMLPELDGKNITSGRINAYTSLVAEYSTPHIFSLSQDSVHEGDQITLFGDRFGPEQGSGRVTFGSGIDAEIISWSECEVKVKVPQGTQSGKVTVTTSEGTSNDIDLTILISYYDETLVGHEFLDGGTAQAWQADDQTWLYHLPFSFPFFGQDYDSVYVCSNGYLDFTDTSPSCLNSQSVLKTRVMIAPLWDDLLTNGTSQQDEDIYVHASSGDSVCFRWAGEHYKTGGPVNVEVTLYRDGRIQFNYGPGNTGLSPTIGISGGGGEDYDLAIYDGKNELTEVEAVLFTPREQSFSIDLDLGWNLISLPLKPKNNQAGQIMGDVNGGIESVWGYEDGVWFVYDPQNPGLSDLQTMKTGHGYWVKTTQEGLNIQIQGQVSPFSLNLTNGWNLIGFNSLQSMPVEVALSAIEDEVESVWGYKDGVWYVYDPQNPGLSDLEEMEPGMGYWIKSEDIR